MRNQDMPAYGEMNKIGDVSVVEGGLTKREYAAIKIMAGFAVCSETGGTVDEIARYAAIWADALFAELEKGQ